MSDNVSVKTLMSLSVDRSDTSAMVQHDPASAQHLLSWSLYCAFQHVSDVVFGDSVTIANANIQGVWLAVECYDGRIGDTIRHDVYLTWDEVLDETSDLSALVESRWHEACRVAECERQRADAAKKARERTARNLKRKTSAAKRLRNERSEYERLKAKYGTGKYTVRTT